MSEPQNTEPFGKSPTALKLLRGSRIVGGFVLLVLGIIGLALPFLQGIAMIIGGLLLLSTEFRWAKWMLVWAKRRWASVRRVVSSRAGKAEP